MLRGGIKCLKQEVSEIYMLIGRADEPQSSGSIFPSV